MTTELTKKVAGSTIELGIIEQRDIERLTEISRQWVKNRDTGVIVEEEVQEIRARMEGAVNGSNGYSYFVVRDGQGDAIGMCALRQPEEKMIQYKASPESNSAELVNVFLDSSQRGKGIGYELMQYCFGKAKELGYDEVIWNSGPRYKNSAWDFYTKLVGPRETEAIGYYGVKGDAPIWRKRL